MSHFHTTGTLHPITKFEDLNLNCMFVLNKHNIEYEYTQSFIPTDAILNAHCYDTFPYIVINGALYIIKNRNDLYGIPFTRASRNLDDTIDFEMVYDTCQTTYLDVLTTALERDS